MSTWATLGADLLWRQALAAIPLVLLVAVITRWLPCRPSTRHVLWLMVLLWLVAAPLLPEAPALPQVAPLRIADFGLRIDSEEPETANPQSTIHNRQSEIRNPQSAIDTGRTSRRSVARSSDTRSNRVADRLESRSHTTKGEALPACQGPGAPKMLAQATGANGPLTVFDRKPLPTARRPSTMWRPQRNSSLTPTNDGRPRAQKPRHIEIGGQRDENPGQITSRRWVAGLIAVRDAIGRLPPLPTNVWFAGAAALALCGLIRMIRFYRRISSASQASSSVRRMVSQAARELGLRRIPETLMVSGRVSPMIWCGQRLRLILPAALWSQLDDAGRRAVIFHELAHVRRRDHWVSWAEMVIGTLYWWNPLVWWVRRRLHAEAELCCDAWVTSLMPRGRRAYAEALLQTKQYIREGPRWTPAMGMGVIRGRAGHLARRITMVMTKSVKPRLSVSGIAMALVIATTGWFTTPAKSCPPKEKCIQAAEAEASAVSAPCKHGKSCKPCKARDKFSKARSTFEEYLVAKQSHAPELATAYGMLLPPHAPGLGMVGGSLLLAGHDEDDLEDRLARLEAELERLAIHLSELTGERVHKKHAKRAKVKREKREGVKAKCEKGKHTKAKCEKGKWDKVKAEKRKRVKVKAPKVRAHKGPHPPYEAPAPPPRRPRPPRPPRAGFSPDIEFFDAGGDSDETMIRVYKLPDGKREALTELMVRNDVPILVRPLPEGIEVHATPRQQHIFCAFINMIHPRADGRSDIGPGERRFDDDTFLHEGPSERFYERQPRPERRRRANRDTGRPEAGERDAFARDQAMREHVEQAKMLAREQKRMEAEARRIEKEADALREQADRVRDDADDVREEADEIRERAEELREKADELREEAESKGEASAAEFLAKAEALMREAREVEDHAHHKELEATNVEREAEDIERHAEDLEREANRVEEEAERVEEEAERVEERMEELEEQAEEAEAKARERDNEM
ncbi:MAG: M56 family metallopeptidase [Phycisphaerae bacterium]